MLSKALPIDTAFNPKGFQTYLNSIKHYDIDKGLQSQYVFFALDSSSY